MKNWNYLACLLTFSYMLVFVSVFYSVVSFPVNAQTSISENCSPPAQLNSSELRAYQKACKKIAVFYEQEMARYGAMLELNIPDLTIIPSLIKELRGLKGVNISGSNISDVSILAGLTDLRTLDASNSKVTNLKALQELESLVMLELSATLINDKNSSQLGYFKNLTYLGISGTNISDLEFLRNSPSKISGLDIRGTKVDDLTALSKLSKLKVLQIDGAKISSLKGIENLKNLEYFSTNHTDISDLSTLKDLENLITLKLENTKVTDIEALSGLKKLNELHIAGTDIVDLSPLVNMSDNSALFIGEEQILDLKPIEHLIDNKLELYRH